MSQEEEGHVQKESTLKDYPNVIPYECTQKILEQMGNYICKINVKQEQATGFFCKIPFPDKNNMLPVFITNNHVINEQILNTKDAKMKIDIKKEKENYPKEIYLNNRIYYTNEEEDITIIEIKKNDDIKYYLELDENIIDGILNEENINNKDYIDKTIYIIQYPEAELSVSYGILDNIYMEQKYNFRHKCSTSGGSSGSPVLNLKNKLIGIHKEGVEKKYNRGTFLNYPIKKFIDKNFETYIKIKKSTNIIDSKKNDNILNNIKNNESLLKEYNQKYGTKIEDNKVKEINLLRHLIQNDQLKDLCKIEFIELEIFNLKENNISDITALENAKFNKLKILNLDKNEISDISSLEKVNFPELKELHLFNNKISDINVLGKVKFIKLEVLDLNLNKISDISVFKKGNFKELRKLYLNGNNITDIKVFEQAELNKLEELYLFDNGIDTEENEDLIYNLKIKIKDLYIDNDDTLYT